MADRVGVIASKGNPLTLTGTEINVGDKAPDAEVIDIDMKPVLLSEYRGKVVILATVPSLDTSVCDAETRRFNKEAASLGDGVAILTVSMDLPTAQKRWCGSAGIDRVRTLSDYRGAKLAQAFGVLIKEIYLAARTVFVIDREGVVRYRQIVKEVGTEPNYEEVIAAVKKLL